MGLVLGGGALAVCHVRGRQGQQGAALHLADGHVGVGEERVELLHQVLAHEVGEVHLVQGVVQDGKEHLLNKKSRR